MEISVLVSIVPETPFKVDLDDEMSLEGVYLGRCVASFPDKQRFLSCSEDIDLDLFARQLMGAKQRGWVRQCLFCGNWSLRTDLS